MPQKINKDINFKKKWDDNIIHIKKDWYFKLHSISILLQFHANYLKDQESSLGWSIIVITSITSFVTLLEFTSIGIDTKINNIYIWARSLIISILSVVTTLLASWIKKKQFIKRIKELDKRVYEIEKTRGKIAAIIDLPIEDRPEYTKFYNENIENVLELTNYSSLITPIEINYSLYNITKNYPNLVRLVPPWYELELDKGCEIIGFKPNFDFGNRIIKNYESQKYNKYLFCRLITCYYCKSECCKEVDDGNPFTIRSTIKISNNQTQTIQINEINNNILKKNDKSNIKKDNSNESNIKKDNSNESNIKKEQSNEKKNEDTEYESDSSSESSNK